MKLRSLCMLVVTVALAFAQDPVIPRAMTPVRMLLGEWAAQGRNGLVDFHFNARSGSLIGRARSLADGAKWRNFLEIYSEGTSGPLHADFWDLNSRITHYQLELATGRMLRFADKRHSLVYEEQSPDRLSYRFETEGRITESGTLVRAANLRPPESHPKLVRPLSD